MTDEQRVRDRIADVRARMDAAAARAGRDPSDARLVAVTKTVAAEIIRVAFDGGVHDFGENRAQELLGKQKELSGMNARWHFIGTLQRNKVAVVTGRVVLIHSVDSEPLAEAIGTHARALGIDQDVLIEVDLSGEGSKHGFEPLAVAESADRISRIDGIRLRGLMTMAAAGDIAAARRTFEQARVLRDQIASRIEGARELSIGMSGDFEVAIEEGATIIRVGSAIFGSR